MNNDHLLKLTRLLLISTAFIILCAFSFTGFIYTPKIPSTAEILVLGWLMTPFAVFILFLTFARRHIRSSVASKATFAAALMAVISAFYSYSRILFRSPIGDPSFDFYEPLYILLITPVYQMLLIAAYALLFIVTHLAKIRFFDY